jgi:hypothetical protein
MKRVIFVLGVLVIAAQAFAQKPDSVYLCMGPQSKVYHKIENCRGLAHCSTKLIQVSLGDAVNKYHRRLCGFEK